MRIVFMGTPDFAVNSLQVLVENEYNIVGVITAPDRKAGRGRKIKHSPIKDYALSKGLKVLQPTNLKSPDFLAELQSLNADLQVVVAFRMLPEAVWNMPPKGTLNLHASLLPDYRGAAPINWAIINGEKETGLTTFFLKHEIDTGNILFQQKVTIERDDNAGTLHDKLMVEGAKLVLKTVNAIAEDHYSITVQDSSKAIHKAPKIFPEDCKIDFHQPAEKIYNFIRGLSPYPGAWCYLNCKIFKIYKASIAEPTAENVAPGSPKASKKYLEIAASDYWLKLEEVQAEKKKRLDIKSFLSGFQEQTITIE